VKGGVKGEVKKAVVDFGSDDYWTDEKKAEIANWTTVKKKVIKIADCNVTCKSCQTSFVHIAEQQKKF
jgi:hypothetical protein